MMRKPICNDRQLFHRTSSPASMLPPPPISTEFDMNWQTTLTQSDPSIQSRQNQFINRLATAAYNSSSYKVSIGHETVNITEIARHREAISNAAIPKATPDQRRHLAVRKSANILSLCFMCFVCASLILIAISMMHLLLKINSINHNETIPYLLQSGNFTPGFMYIFATTVPSTETISNLLLPIYDRTIRDLATVVCLSIVVLNCFCLLVFSIEIYLGCNITKTKNENSHHRRCRFLFSISTSRFIAICSFYASIPALILVMCLFILLNMSLTPAIISLVVLGIGLIFIFMTLLTYFSNSQKSNRSTANDKFPAFSSSLYRAFSTNLEGEDDIDLSKADELSTLV